jgi:hypothetical protein
MNYCRKCQSDYEKPGTCNCFAASAPPISWPPNVSFTCPICGKLNCYETHVTVFWGDVAGGTTTISTVPYEPTQTVDARSVKAPWSYTGTAS